MRARTITRLLARWDDGDDGARAELAPLVYDELRRIARGLFCRECPGHTLQPTAVVHEAYVRLWKRPPSGWRGRRHFFGIAARLMRQVLVDHSRERKSLKRGGGVSVQPLDSSIAIPNDDRLLALDDALRDLSRHDPRKGRLVELRYFGGLTVAEAADCLDMSRRTGAREWNKAKAWLYQALSAQSPNAR